MLWVSNIYKIRNEICWGQGSITANKRVMKFSKCYISLVKRNKAKQREVIQTEIAKQTIKKKKKKKKENKKNHLKKNFF